MKLLKILKKPFPYTFNNVTLYIILINIIVYFFQGRIGQHSFSFIAYFELRPYLFFAKNMFWQMFTYMFLHGSFWHLFFNMLTLFWFGVAVERKVGSYEFLLFYFTCGILAGLGMAIFYQLVGIYTYIVGASGALYGVMLLFAVLYPDSNIYLYFVLPIPSAALVIAYFVIELLSIFSNDGIAHFGHLFGLIFGWLYIKIRYGVSILRVFGFK